MQLVGALELDAHDHAAIIEQQFVTDIAVLDQCRIIDADHFLGAGGARVAGGEAEQVAVLELDTLVLEFGDTDFRALQVAEQGDMTAVLGSQFADQGSAGLVVIRCAVGEVQTGHVETGEDQLLQHFRRAAGRAQGGDDFGAAKGHARTP